MSFVIPGYLRSHLKGFVLIGALLASTSPALSAPNAARGGEIFQSKCAVCHDTVAGKVKVGPSLHQVVGHKAGANDSFPRYYALKGANWTWNEQILDSFLTDPQAFTKSKVNKMSSMILKVPEKQDRDDVIEYLKTLK